MCAACAFWGGGVVHVCVCRAKDSVLVVTTQRPVTFSEGLRMHDPHVVMWPAPCLASHTLTHVYTSPLK